MLTKEEIKRAQNGILKMEIELELIKYGFDDLYEQLQNDYERYEYHMNFFNYHDAIMYRLLQSRRDLEKDCYHCKDSRYNMSTELYRKYVLNDDTVIGLIEDDCTYKEYQNTKMTETNKLVNK